MRNFTNSNKVEPLFPYVGSAEEHEQEEAIGPNKNNTKSSTLSVTSSQFKVSDDALESEDSGMGLMLEYGHKSKLAQDSGSNRDTSPIDSPCRSAVSIADNHKRHSLSSTDSGTSPGSREGTSSKNASTEGTCGDGRGGRRGSGGQLLKHSSLAETDNSSYFGSSESMNNRSAEKSKNKRSVSRPLSQPPLLVKQAGAKQTGETTEFVTLQELPAIKGTHKKAMNSSVNGSTSEPKLHSPSGSGKLLGAKEESPVPRILPPLKGEPKKSIGFEISKNPDKSVVLPSLTLLSPSKQQMTDPNLSKKASLLPVIPTTTASSRSYLLGNVDSVNGSLLGASELDRYFPNRKVQIYVSTWNVHGSVSVETLNDFFLPNDIENLPDMYVVGIQEASPHRVEWEIKVQETIGPSHVLFHSVAFGSLHLVVLLKRDLIWFCSVPEDAIVNTRVGTTYKTKGAVAICFRFFGTSLLFITSHLTAHDDKVKERLLDYQKIISGLNIPRLLSLKPHQYSSDVTERFDCVFWCGDLNFRLAQERLSVLNQIEVITQQPEPNFEDLLRDDQLSQKMSQGAVFKGFSEGQINFMPTYKYNIGTCDFDSSTKLRTPSYTDRVLFRSKQKNAIACILYNSAHQISVSDHKPVYGMYEVDLSPGREDVPLAAGRFNRDIYLEALKRRSTSMNPLAKRTASCSSVCALM